MTARRVRELTDLLSRTRSTRDASPVREHKAVDALLAEIEHRLALHGEPTPAPLPPTPSPRRGLAQAPPAPAGRSRPDRDDPVLALRPGPGSSGDTEGFADTWEWFRDAVDGTRRHADRLRGEPDSKRRAVVAGAWLDYADLADAADELTKAVRRVRPSAGADR